MEEYPMEKTEKEWYEFAKDVNEKVDLMHYAFQKALDSYRHDQFIEKNPNFETTYYEKYSETISDQEKYDKIQEYIPKFYEYIQEIEHTPPTNNEKTYRAVDYSYDALNRMVDESNNDK